MLLQISKILKLFDKQNNIISFGELKTITLLFTIFDVSLK